MKNRIRTFFKGLKVFSLGAWTAFGTGVIIDFFARFFTGGNGLNNAAVITILVISFVLWMTFYIYIYYYDENNDKGQKQVNVEGQAYSGGSYSNNRAQTNITCSSVNSTVSSNEKRGYNGPKTLPMGCYEPFFDLDNDGKMSEYETYLQWENDQHMKNDTPNQFWGS